MIRFSLCLLALGLAPLTAHADECASWGHRAFPVTLEACSYDSGGSGYYRITNDGSSAARICWTVVSNSGREDDGCNNHLESGESTTGSCFDCGSNNDGVKYILLKRYEAVD